MVKQDYLTRLERWARWRLPAQEAEDVIADYRDIVGDPPRPEEELLRDLGQPRDVIRPLTQARPYRVWMAQFLIMAACIVLPSLGPWPCMGLYAPELFGDFPTYFIHFQRLWWFFFGGGLPLYRLPLVLGMLLPLICFRERAGGPFPKSIPILLAALALGMVLPWWLFWQICGYPDAFLWNCPGINGQLFHVVMIWTAFAAAVVGVMGLVKARVRDRRWRSVYLMALTTAMVNLTTEALLSSMDISSWTDPIQLGLVEKLVITVAGLLCAGVGLC